MVKRWLFTTRSGDWFCALVERVFGVGFMALPDPGGRERRGRWRWS